jgi:integrase
MRPSGFWSASRPANNKYYYLKLLCTKLDASSDVITFVMASIWKHPHSPYWTACFRDSLGKQRRISTKTTDKKTARRIAQEFEATTRKRRTIGQLEKVLRTLHEEFCGESVGQHSLRSFCTAWIEEKTPSVSVSSAKFYRTTVKKLCAHFGPRADQPISEIRRDDLIQLRNRLANEERAVSVNHDLIAIRMIFGDARRRGHFAESPAADIKPIRESLDRTEPSRRAFTITELQAILAVADPEWQSMIRLALYSGGRLSDIATLRWSNVDLTRGELRFTAKKTGKATLIPICDALRVHLLSLPCALDLQAPLHPRALASVERRGSSATLSAQFAVLLEQSGLRPVQPQEKGTKRHRRSALS